jgi:3-oxoacyl-(acyl-carrier-protein) synthase
MSRSSQLGLVAAQQAIAEAKLMDGEVDCTEIGIIVGSSIGGYAASDPSYKSFYTQNRLSPFTIPVSMNAGPAANISIRYGLQGPLVNVDAACATAGAFNRICL